jgi:hypothetical protein
MAAVALKSQEATVMEVKNFETMIKLLNKEDQQQVQDEQKDERRLMIEECRQSNLEMQKIVDELFPSRRGSNLVFCI